MSFIGGNLPPKYAVSDWKTSNQIIRANAERLRDSSHLIRQDARRLTNETENHTRWTQHDSNVRLDERISNVNDWRQSLERCLSQTDKEIALLQEEKTKVEQALAAKQLPLDVAMECLMLRENRVGIDLVKDIPEVELHKEVEVIEGSKALLQQKATEAFEQLCLLEEARHQLHCDLTDKYKALEIDNHCLQLNNNSADISLQVNPTRTVSGSVSPQTWESFSQYNKLRADAEMNASSRLREAMFATMEKTKNDLEAQRRATEYAYRKRIQETEQAKSELEWQKKNTLAEIEDMKLDIKSLKEAIDAKLAPMMVAQTRLENRTKRPNVELCRDAAQYQLCHEVAELEGTIKALKEKLNVSETALRALDNDLKRLEQDLGIKTNSLSIDQTCMDIRKHLTQPQKNIDGARPSVEKSLVNDLHVATEHNRPKKLSFSDDTKEKNGIGDYRDDRISQLAKEFNHTTYQASYKTNSSLRMNDLQRALNKSTDEQHNTKQVVLVD